MKLIIDMQGAQADSRNRGIGKYTMSFVDALLRGKGTIDILLVLNGDFFDTVAVIKSAFENLIPENKFHVWYPIVPAYGLEEKNIENRKISESIYEEFILELEPDCVLITNMFEAHRYCNNAITTINNLQKRTKVAVVLYDLIPLLNPETHLSDKVVCEWYHEKLTHLLKADLLLAISESARTEGLENLGFSDKKIINISSAVSKEFFPRNIKNKVEVYDHFGISKPFIMHTGGLDERKNVKGLIQAYSQLPLEVRNHHQLVIVFDLDEETRNFLMSFSKENGLTENELILTGFVDDSNLLALYNLCKLFVFPSLHEGFGLPVLEAMSCGRATIASNTSSLPEVIGREDALFDPYDINSITKKICEVLSNERFQHELENFGLKRAQKFSWEQSAIVALSSINVVVNQNQ